LKKEVKELPPSSSLSYTSRIGPFDPICLSSYGCRANACSVFQLFSFLVVCDGIVSKVFDFVKFFGSEEVSSVCIQCKTDLAVTI
jgi:hypothetical protein